MSFKFLNYDNDDSGNVIAKKHEAYRNYLMENRKLFPPEAFEFAIADWHYNPQDNRCPHDSWVQSLNILEEKLSPDSPGSKERGIEIRLSLLGAYHDGRIEIIYTKVRSYYCRLSPNSSFQSKWHGDWLIDEMRLSDENYLIHDINFWLDGNWQIECENILYSWLPL